MNENTQVAKQLELLAMPMYPSLGNNDVCPTGSDGQVVNSSHCKHNNLAPGPNQVLTSIESVWSYWLDSSAELTFQTYGNFVSPAHGSIGDTVSIINLNTISWLPNNNVDTADCILARHIL